MRVVYLAAGAGGMYCGSCMRDNRLAATLIAQGRDVNLIPLYTPLRTDEEVVGERKVRFGGINVFLRHRFALFRALPSRVTGFLDAPSLLRLAGRFSSGTRPEDLGPLTVSVLEGDEGTQRAELEELVGALRAFKPNLVNLPNLMFTGHIRRLKAELECPVLVTLSGEDAFLDRLPEPHRSRALDLIRSHAAAADGFVAVTKYFADRAAAHFGLPADRVHHVPMGIETRHFDSPAAPSDEPFTIGYLARICSEKGLHVLCEALVRLVGEGRKCRLRIAGHLGRSERSYVRSVREVLRKGGAEHAVEWLGSPDLAGKVDMLRTLHVLSVPAEYPEAKGFYVLEAMAAGVPVVQPRHGAFPELLEVTRGGILYDDVTAAALADALAEMMDNPGRRLEHAAAGREAVRRLFTAERMANETWALYGRILQRKQ